MSKYQFETKMFERRIDDFTGERPYKIEHNFPNSREFIAYTPGGKFTGKLSVYGMPLKTSIKFVL